MLLGLYSSGLIIHSSDCLNFALLFVLCTPCVGFCCLALCFCSLVASIYSPALVRCGRNDALIFRSPRPAISTATYLRPSFSHIGRRLCHPAHRPITTLRLLFSFAIVKNSSIYIGGIACFILVVPVPVNPSLGSLAIFTMWFTLPVSGFTVHMPHSPPLHLLFPVVPLGV